MTPTKDMSDGAFEAIAQRFRALSDPVRLKILYHLGTEELTVNELVERAGSSQSNISKHLSILYSHGLVRRRRAGTSVYYSIADLSIFDLCEQVCGGIDRDLETRRKAFH
ncbi:MAG: metalloregulator ArsR/SmtB family transcription factor [Candidatus Krumholzibacteria bacterium]|nr:metalloregulator ArsR/SmtB family transcription factor [Candidatus Krumholzibacteria bacterium]